MREAEIIMESEVAEADQSTPLFGDAVSHCYRGVIGEVIPVGKDALCGYKNKTHGKTLSKTPGEKACPICLALYNNQAIWMKP